MKVVEVKIEKSRAGAGEAPSGRQTAAWVGPPPNLSGLAAASELVYLMSFTHTSPPTMM